MGVLALWRQHLQRHPTAKLQLSQQYFNPHNVASIPG